MLQLTNAALLLAAPLALVLVLLAVRRTRQPLSRGRRIASSAIRLASVLLLTMVMATPVLTRRSVQPFCTIFVVDVSQSVPTASWERALPDLRRAWDREIAAGNYCGLVAFGGRAEPLIPPGREPFPENTERIAHRLSLRKHAAAAEAGETGAAQSMSGLQEWRGHLDVSSTNLTRALAAAQALYREDSGNRIVLVTDGRDSRRAPDEIEVPPGLVAVRLDEAAGRDVAVAGVEAPLTARAGAPFDVIVALHATRPADVKLTVTLDGRPVKAQGTERVWPIRNAGRTTLRLANLQQDGAFDAGLHRLEVIAEAPGDEESWNNVGAAAVTVTGKPRVLLLEGSPAEGAPLAGWLRAQDIEFARESPDRTAARNVVLEEYVAVILAGVPRQALPSRFVQALSKYVKNSGGGLWVVGSPDLQGPGGYAGSGLEALLPVTFLEEKPTAGGATKPPPPAPAPPDPPPPSPKPGTPKRVLAPTVAILFVVDKSGSMAGKNIALVKAACIASAKALTPKDYVGVLAFDVRPHWVLKFTEADRQRYIEQLVGRLFADGGTHVYPALVETLAAFRGDPRARSASLKHAVLLSDGDTQPADFESVVRELAREGVTVSTVCVSAPRFNPALMSRIAGWGRGKFRFTDSFSRVPEIFVQETARVLKTLPRSKDPLPRATPPPSDPPTAKPEPKPEPPPKEEKPSRPVPVVVRDPHEILQGIDADPLPALTGLLATAPRPNGDVRIPLATADGRPVLALWRAGLGKTAVWTADLSGRWSREWSLWGDSGKLVAQLVRHVSSAAPDTEFASRVYVKRENGHAVVRIDPGPADEKLMAWDADTRDALPLKRRRDGGREVHVALQDVGKMRRILLQPGDGKSLPVGAVEAYDREFAPPDPKHDFFAGPVRPVEWDGLAARLETARSAGEDRVALAPWLILVVLFLLPIDVALRRFNVA